jgi:hypothetical protein
MKRFRDGKINKLNATHKWSTKALTMFAIAVLTTCATLVQAFSADDTFAVSINGRIECEEVVRNVGVVQAPGGGITEDDSSFLCLVDPNYTLTGSKNIELELLNLKDSFEQEREEAHARGKTRLCIMNSSVGAGTVSLPPPDELDNIVCPNDPFGEEGEEQCWMPTLIWHSPSPDQMQKANARKLNESKQNRSILVFRISTTTAGSPTASSVAVSNDVFGTVDTVNVASQYAACSNGKLDFSPATPNGLALSAIGVYDIFVPTTSSSISSGILNAVKTQVGDEILDQIDHYFFQMVSWQCACIKNVIRIRNSFNSQIFAFHQPPGTPRTVGGSNTWIAFASFVSFPISLFATRNNTHSDLN